MVDDDVNTRAGGPDRGHKGHLRVTNKSIWTRFAETQPLTRGREYDKTCGGLVRRALGSVFTEKVLQFQNRTSNTVDFPTRWYKHLRWANDGPVGGSEGMP